MKQRRFESRFLCADLVRVEWVTGAREPRRVEGVLEDISAAGGCIQVEEPIPPGALIAISAGEAWLSGCVTYCVYQEDGYFVGIHFAEDAKWSPVTFEPQHLTNLSALSHRAD
jgi:hypothetical protein